MYAGTNGWPLPPHGIGHWFAARTPECPSGDVSEQPVTVAAADVDRCVIRMRVECRLRPTAGAAPTGSDSCLTCDTLTPVAEVTIRELRNHGGDVVRRVLAGESLVVTRSGTPVAELRPVRRPGIEAPTLLERWRHLPPVEPEKLRSDIDDVLDARL